MRFIPGKDIIRSWKRSREYDRLIAMDAAKEAGEHLERCLKQFEAAGDWGAQITILNEMMGFYRNQGEEQKGLESVKKGIALVQEHRMADSASGGTTF